MQTSRMSSLLTQMHKCASVRKICTKMQHMCICTRGASISMYDLALQRQLQHMWWSCGILIWKKSSELDLWLEKLYQGGGREGGGGRKGEVEETITVKETINWREWDIRGEKEKQEERGKETRQGVKGHCSDLHFSYSWNTESYSITVILLCVEIDTTCLSSGISSGTSYGAKTLACPVATKRKTAGTLAGRTAQRHSSGWNNVFSNDCDKVGYIAWKQIIMVVIMIVIKLDI